MPKILMPYMYVVTVLILKLLLVYKDFYYLYTLNKYDCNEFANNNVFKKNLDCL